MPRAIELACSRERAFCTPWCSVQANPRLTASFRWVSPCSSIRRIPSSRPSDDPRRPPTVSGPNRPKPARASQTPQPVSPASLSRAAPLRPPEPSEFDSFGTGFRGCPTKYRPMSDLQTLAATLMPNFAPVRIPRCEILCTWRTHRRPSTGTGCCHVRGRSVRSWMCRDIRS